LEDSHDVLPGRGRGQISEAPNAMRPGRTGP
jgi:hypothetical protein